MLFGYKSTRMTFTFKCKLDCLVKDFLSALEKNAFINCNYRFFPPFVAITLPFTKVIF